MVVVTIICDPQEGHFILSSKNCINLNFFQYEIKDIYPVKTKWANW